MKGVIAAITVLSFFNLGLARPQNGPSVKEGILPSFATDPFIIGGVPAAPGEFPHQMILHTSSSLSSLRCGAVLLSATQALTAAHCVDGSSQTGLYVTGGVYLRDDPVYGQTRQLTAHKMHDGYCSSCGGFPNDIAVLTFTSVDLEMPDIGPARLPENNDNDLAGDICTISGWGRTSDSSTLPSALYKANIEIIFHDECFVRMEGISGATVYKSHICVFDRDGGMGSCNGDSGGPLSCPLSDPEDPRTHFLAGLTSWGISSSGNCLQSYPSVYTRVAFFLDWIADNTNP